MSLGEHSIVNIPATKRHSTKDPSDDQPLAIPPNEDVYFEIRLLAINGNQAETPDEGLPEQGYSGKKVKHEEGKTCVEDWRREYGPKMGEKGPCGGGDDDNEPKKEPKKLEKKKLHTAVRRSASIATLQETQVACCSHQEACRNSSNFAPDKIALACFNASISSSRAVCLMSKFFMMKSQLWCNSAL